MDWNFGFSQQAPGDYGPGEAPQQTGLLSYLGDMLRDPRKANALATFGEALSRAGAPSATKNNWAGGLGQAFAGMRQGNQQYDDLQARNQMQDLQRRTMQQTLDQKIDPLSYFDKVAAKDYTPESIREFLTTKDPSKLQARKDVKIAPNGTAYDPTNTPVGTNLGSVSPHNFGGTTGFLDQSGNIRNSIVNTMSPEAQASNKLGWANYGLAKENQNMPVIQSGPNGEVFAVDRRAGTGAQVNGPDGQPLSKGEKPLTESQGQASMYLGMMKEASKTLSTLDKPSTIQTAWAKGEVPMVPTIIQNVMANKTAQKNAQAQLQWTEAMLRITTGATAPPEEVKRTAATFFPKVGDAPDVIKQKAEQRAQMEKYVALKAGNGADKVDSVVNNGGWSITPVE